MKRRLFLIDQNPVRRARVAIQLGALDGVEVVAQAAAFDGADRDAALTDGCALCVAPELLMRKGFSELATRLEYRGVRVVPYPHLPGTDEVGARYRVLAEAIVRASLAPVSGSKTATLPSAEAPVICIGASTGGLPVLQEILGSFPADAPATMIVQHIRGSFSSSLAERLNRNCQIEVMEAYGGAPLQRGRAYLAPGDDLHMEVGGRAAPLCRLVPGPPCTGHRPSVNRLFRSAARLTNILPIGVLLTGMGRDGAEGLLEIRNRGGCTIVQDSATSTVFGMPKAAVELGAAQKILPKSAIGPEIMRMVARLNSAATGGNE